MYLAEVCARNFRLFGNEDNGMGLRLALKPGLNVIMGENDAGKTAIIDIIRLVLWTTSFDYTRITEDDFRVEGSTRASEMLLRCTFRGLNDHEIGRFSEYLSVENGTNCLHISLRAVRHEDSLDTRRRISVTCHAGQDVEGPRIDGEIREYLKATYLRPLRDAEALLSAGRGSRLAQILQAHPECLQEGECREGYNPDMDDPITLVEIMRYAEHLVQQNEFLVRRESDLNDQYLRTLSVGLDTLVGEISIAKRTELRHILEKLELWLKPREGVELRIPRGLGVNNVLFMATELLLLGAHDCCPLLLVEEPEAHLHPQLQLRLIDFLEDRTNRGPVQILLTTHSPNLASRANLENVTLVHSGKCYSLASQQTRLDESDYRYLRRFLDATRANLFFAKGVVLVEGDAENLLLPTLSRLIGRDFAMNGVSIVNVGSRGLFRYARIFQRTNAEDIPIPVACIADRDIIPDEVTYAGERRGESDYTPEEIEKIVESIRLRQDDGLVRTFVSEKWTFEYDLARTNLATYVHTATLLAKKARTATFDPVAIEAQAEREFEGLRAEELSRDELAARVYEPLYKHQASKAECAQFLASLLEKADMSPPELMSALPNYLVEAIKHVTPTADDSDAADVFASA